MTPPLRPILPLAAALACAAPLIGCAVRITPPTAVADPVTVFVADYGRHASLLLPGPTDGVAEYAYGEWEWFALGHTGWWRVGEVLFLPTRGTIAHRNVACAPTSSAISRALPLEALHEVVVERRRVLQLHQRLAERFDRHADTTIADGTGLHFRPDDTPYCIAHHCNSEVARWLRELGCVVNGNPLIAHYTVEAGIAGSAR